MSTFVVVVVVVVVVTLTALPCGRSASVGRLHGSRASPFCLVNISDCPPYSSLGHQWPSLPARWSVDVESSSFLFRFSTIARRPKPSGFATSNVRYPRSAWPVTILISETLIANFTYLLFNLLTLICYNLVLWHLVTLAFSALYECFYLLTFSIRSTWRSPCRLTPWITRNCHFVPVGLEYGVDGGVDRATEIGFRRLPCQADICLALDAGRWRNRREGEGTRDRAPRILARPSSAVDLSRRTRACSRPAVR